MEDRPDIAATGALEFNTDAPLQSIAYKRYATLPACSANVQKHLHATQENLSVQQKKPYH
jgi:hypothetical protein